MRNPFVRRHPFGEEELSAYLDGRLSPAETARLERHVASCGPCRRHLKELRAVVEGLRDLPSVLSPRSFALRPEQVEAPQRRRPAGAAWLPRASALGPAGAAVVSLVVLLVLVGVDLGSLGGGGAPEAALPSSAKEAMQADRSLSAAPAPTSPGNTQGFEAPSMQAPGSVPAPTPAPELAPRTGAEEPQTAGTPQAFAGATAPTETPAPTAEAPTPPTATAEGGGDTGRWVLRGFQGLAGAAFLASVALLWRRRRRAGRI